MARYGSVRTAWMVAGCGMLAVATAWFVWSGPASSHAAAAQFGGSTAGVCSLEPRYTGVRLEESPAGHWMLLLGINWECPPSRRGVEQAVGVLRVSSTRDGSDQLLELPCRLNVSVRPGQPLNDTVGVEWDESDPSQRWIRGVDPADVHVEFVAHSFTPTPAPSAVDTKQPETPTRVRRNRGSATAGFHKITVRTGVTH
jgi:hypothetical protein